MFPYYAGDLALELQRSSNIKEFIPLRKNKKTSGAERPRGRFCGFTIAPVINVNGHFPPHLVKKANNHVHATSTGEGDIAGGLTKSASAGSSSSSGQRRREHDQVVRDLDQRQPVAEGVSFQCAFTAALNLAEMEEQRNRVRGVQVEEKTSKSILAERQRAQSTLEV